MSESVFNDAVYLDGIPKDDWRKKYIGPGYRSVCYKTDHERKGQIVFFGYDLAGNPKTFVCPHRSRLKYNVKYDTPEKDQYGRFVATKYFDNSQARRKYIEASDGGIRIVEALRPEQEFLHDMFDADVFTDDFNRQPMRIHYLDIETEISQQFVKPSDASNRVNMITIYDTKLEKFFTWSLQHAEKKFDEGDVAGMPEDRFVLFEFHDDEISMLEHFIEWLDSNRADVVTGWNICGYDIPYMYTRILKQLGKAQADRLSPVDRCYVKEINHDNARADVAAEIEIVIDGLFQSDGLRLYRDKFKVAGSSIDGGYGLDNVGEHEGLGNKVKYKGTLKDLYLKDWQKFYNYNLMDVSLCKAIDEKCKLTSLARQIAGYGLCNYDTIYSSISYLVGSLIAFSKVKMGGKVFTSYLKEKQNFGSGYEGAFVFPCVPHIYRGGEGVIDFASLYPSIIRVLNISPETYVGKVLVYTRDSTGAVTADPMNAPMLDLYGEGESVLDTGDERIMPVLNAGDPAIDHFELRLPGQKDIRKQITLEQIRQLVKEKCIWTPNNTLFLKHEVKDGVVAKWCEYFYNLRKSIKRAMMKDVHLLHNEEETAKLTEKQIAEKRVLIENREVAQLGVKCMINSVYGMCGTGFSPIADPHIAQTITRMGKTANTRSAQYIKKCFIEDYGAPPDYNIACGGDTDSVFVNLECVTDWMKKEYSLDPKIRKWPKKYRDMLWKTMSDFVDNRVNEYVRGFARDFCGSSNSKVLTYELEYMSDTILIEGKKHYATRKLYDEGDPVDKIKVSGIELKKGNVPKNIKEFLWDCYRGVIEQDWTEADYTKYITALYEKFRTFSIDDISFWKGYNTERAASGFLQMAQTVNPVTGKTVGTTGIAKAATYYNQIIEKMGLGKRYESLRLGDKCRFLYIDENNPYRINVMAYKDGQWPVEFNNIFKPDYKTMFEKLILDPLKRFREACRFSDTDPSKQVVFDIFSL